MNKPIVKNWMRYWAGSLAISGMLVMGACGSDDRPADEVTTVETETVTRPVETPEYDNEEAVATETTETTETYQASANTGNQWNRAGWGGSSANIKSLLQQYPEVNQAIRNTLSDVNAEYTAGVDGEYTATSSDGSAMDQQGLSYDRMSNTNMDTDVDAETRSPEAMGEEMSDADYQMLIEEYDDVNRAIRDVLRQNPGIGVQYTDNYVGVYTDVEDENVRRQLDELERRRTETRDRMRGRMDTRTNTYLSAEVDAAPRPGFDELYEFIEDQIDYPQNAQAAGIEGTIFVEFTVDQNGNVHNPAIIETIEGHRNPDRTALNPNQVSPQERQQAIQTMEQEALEAISATNGMWNPAMMRGQAVAETVQLPVRFRLDNMEIGR